MYQNVLSLLLRVDAEIMEVNPDLDFSLSSLV